jgi:hypothetical protein
MANKSGFFCGRNMVSPATQKHKNKNPLGQKTASTAVRRAPDHLESDWKKSGCWPNEKTANCGARKSVFV